MNIILEPIILLLTIDWMSLVTVVGFGEQILEFLRVIQDLYSNHIKCVEHQEWLKYFSNSCMIYSNGNAKECWILIEAQPYFINHLLLIAFAFMHLVLNHIWNSTVHYRIRHTLHLPDNQLRFCYVYIFSLYEISLVVLLVTLGWNGVYFLWG